MSHLLLLSLLTIPKGKVTTYKLLADHFHIHPRTVAKILSQNQDINNYPCYKVIHHDGKIGGYNQGVEEKIRRLQADGIIIHDNQIDSSYFFAFSHNSTIIR